MLHLRYPRYTPAFVGQLLRKISQGHMAPEFFVEESSAAKI